MVNVLLAPVILRLLPASQVAVVVWPKYPMTVSSPMLTFADVGVLALGEVLVLVLVDGGVQVPGVGLLEPGLMMPQPASPTAVTATARATRVGRVRYMLSSIPANFKYPRESRVSR